MTDPATAYAQSVVRGKVPAGKYHKLACARHLRDMKRQGARGFPYWFESARAARLARFAGQLKHYKGELAGQFIELQPWQLFVLGSVVGWVHRETGLRRFRTAFHNVPRKNGKTLTAAIVLLYLTFFDGEAGAEGFSVATKRDQAKLVFNDAKKLVQSSGLKSLIQVRVANLHSDKTSSKVEPIGADHDSTDGLNPHVVIVDEMHAMKDRGMIDVMETATAARRQPCIYEITTFGNDPVSPWGDQYDYACKILDGVLVDESFFTFSTHADPEDDWTLPATARKANPNYGVSVSPDDLKAKVLKAKSIPAAAATYKQKHLNLLVSTLTPCLPLDGWKKGQSEWHPDEMLHEPCFVGVDLASVIDLCAVSFVFPPTDARESWRVLQWIWTPEETAADRGHRDRAPYALWIEQGHLLTTPGTRIDHRVVREVLNAQRERFDIQTIGFDPWHADMLIEQLKVEDGFAEEQVLAVSQTYKGLSSACLRMQAEILAGNMDARGCPVTTWAVSNVVGQRDGKDNLMFAKGKSRGRIDPVIAATIGVSLAIAAPVDSVGEASRDFSERGLWA